MTSTGPRTRCRVQCVGHPAQRCGVQRGAANGKGPLPGIPGYRVKARYDVAVTPHNDAGARKVPLVGIAFAGIPRPYFLDTASRRGMTWSTASQRSMTKKVRNDRSHIRRKRAASTKQTPPLSGREETSRPRKKGEDCLSTASSAAPEGGDRLRARMPDNSGGTSWFVLLAAEKNEHTVSPRTAMRGPARECGMTGRRGPGKELDNNSDTSDFVPLDDKKNGHIPSKKEQKTGARNKKIAMFNISNVKNQGRKICSINNFFALSTILVKF